MKAMLDPVELSRRQSWLTALGLGPNTWVVLAACPDDFRLIRQAIWTFDIVRHTDPLLQLILPHVPTCRARALRFTQQLAFDDNRVTLLTEPFRMEWIPWANIVWQATGRADFPATERVFSLTEHSPVSLAAMTYRELQRQRAARMMDRSRSEV